jgi:hypothetical protein
VPGTKPDGTPTYELTISSVRRDGGRWGGYVAYDANACPYHPQLSQCTGFGRAYPLEDQTHAGLTRVFSQALAVISQARHHKPVSTPDPEP